MILLRPIALAHSAKIPVVRREIGTREYITVTYWLPIRATQMQWLSQNDS